MYDEHARPYHQQGYANAACNRKGALLDLVELSLAKTPTDKQKTSLERALSNAFAGALEQVNWSRDTLLIADVRADYYDITHIEQQLQKLDTPTCTLHYSYTARLDKLIKPGAGKHSY